MRIALAAKGLAFDYRAVNILEGAQRGDEHSDRNPLMQVPVLECDDLLTGSRIRLTQVTAHRLHFLTRPQQQPDA